MRRRLAALLRQFKGGGAPAVLYRLLSHHESNWGRAAFAARFAAAIVSPGNTSIPPHVLQIYPQSVITHRFLSHHFLPSTKVSEHM